MEINQQSVFQQTSSTPSTSTSSSSDASSALSSDFETFLLMLTTQMENQDPLNPVESQEFALQLATFSGVEQQVRTNELLESLTTDSLESDLSQLANWVGLSARVEAPVYFNGAPVELVVSTRPEADRAELVVTNSDGVEVSRETIPMDAETMEWAGVGSNGLPLPEGQYLLQIANIQGDETIELTPVSHYNTVTEARRGLESIELVMSGGTVVTPENVTAFRAAQTLE